MSPCRTVVVRAALALATLSACALEHPVTLVGTDTGTDIHAEDLASADTLVGDDTGTDDSASDVAGDTPEDFGDAQDGGDQYDVPTDGPTDASDDGGTDAVTMDAVSDTGVMDTGVMDTGVDVGSDVPGADGGSAEAGTDSGTPSGWHTVPSVTSQTPWEGGDHAGPTTLACAAGELMVGTVLQSSQYVNAIGLRCAHLNPDGSFGPSRRIDPRGGDRGTPDDETCPAGDAVPRMEGRAGAVVDQLTPVCASVVDWYTAGVLGIRLPTHGEDGGSPWAAPCPARQMAMGVQLTTTYFDDFTRVQALRTLCIGVSP